MSEVALPKVENKCGTSGFEETTQKHAKSVDDDTEERPQKCQKTVQNNGHDDKEHVQKSKTNQVELFLKWVAEKTKDRDESHGICHFKRVRSTAIKIAEEEIKQNAKFEVLATPDFCPMKVIELAALGHDVLDHKYVSVEKQVEEGLHMRMFLRDAGVTELEIEAVMLIMANVSFSKEKAGKLEVDALNARGWMVLRDIVSDADKIDAIGEEGLARCFEYTRSTVNGDEGKIDRLVREHCTEKLLLLKDNYIHTAVGKALAEPHHMSIVRFCEPLTAKA